MKEIRTQLLIAKVISAALKTMVVLVTILLFGLCGSLVEETAPAGIVIFALIGGGFMVWEMAKAMNQADAATRALEKSLKRQQRFINLLTEKLRELKSKQAQE